MYKSNHVALCFKKIRDLDIRLPDKVSIISSLYSLASWYFFLWYTYIFLFAPYIQPFQLCYSVETPSMVNPPWNILYWGSKWIFITVCRDAVGCEWGTNSVYFGITYVLFFAIRRPVFAVEPQYQYHFFCQKYHLKDPHKIFIKINVGLKLEWGS